MSYKRSSCKQFNPSVHHHHNNPSAITVITNMQLQKQNQNHRVPHLTILTVTSPSLSISSITKSSTHTQQSKIQFTLSLISFPAKSTTTNNNCKPANTIPESKSPRLQSRSSFPAINTHIDVDSLHLIFSAAIDYA